MTTRAWHIHLNGIVQGVGFRPFVYKLADELGIKGWVNNSSHGVNIHAEGDNLELFYQRLLNEVPQLAKIYTSNFQIVKHEGFQEFSIIESEVKSLPNVLTSPDVATCKDCLEEIRSKDDRRYRYPFTNCTNCGPRYTIIKSLPYDRANTTMSSFPMCEICAEEYENPLDRRFHAQPTACHDCGPRTVLIDRKGNELSGIGIEQLSQGAIIAIKGLGGFHLACDATNEQAVSRLRSLKERGAKPFAVMVKDIETAREWVELSPHEEELLLSPAAPIVVAPKRASTPKPLPQAIAPNIHTLGVMLPYTPIHHLLFEGSLNILVMTSANLSGRPLIYKNEEAVVELKDIADYFLLHDRDIYHPCDDSVVQTIGNTPVFFRRARGYVPLPLECPEIRTPLLGTGGELKNAFCLAQGKQAFLSQYLGDMEGYENYQRFLQELESYQRVVNITPRAVGYDLHPNYQTTRYAHGLDCPKTAIQHHHAHLVSVLGEHQIEEPTLGVICDGTGYGEDGRIWGFEFLFGNHQSYHRLAHLEYFPLPGGDSGTKHPLRIAYAYVKTFFDEKDLLMTEPLWKFNAEERQIINQQLKQGFQIYWTSSAGRLFDMVSALLGVCYRVTYEGQAAIELESVATQWQSSRDREQLKGLKPYFFDIIDSKSGPMVLSVKKMVREIIADRLNGKDSGEIAYTFHLTIAKAIVATIARCQADNDRKLVLNGGVFQNKLLTELLLAECKSNNYKVLRAKVLPPGDGGIAFGQILIANEVLKNVFSDSSEGCSN